MNPYGIEILVVDKNPVNLSFTLNFLGKQGYRINGATGYREALQKIRNSDYDLVILYEGLEEREIDYIENLAMEIKPELRIIYFSGSIQKLPSRINHTVQKNS